MTVIALALAVLCVAWLTAAATAVRSVSRLWLRHWAEQRLAMPGVIGTYATHPRRLLIASRAGVAALVATCGVVLGTAHLAGWWRVAAAYVILSLVLLLVGQLIPRALARRWAPRLVPVLLPPLEVAAAVAAPFTRGMRVVMRALRRHAGRPQSAAASDGVDDLLREGELEGIGERDENRIITGVVEFGEKVLRDVMTPRAAVVAIDADVPPEQAARTIARSGFSRIPVYRGSRDRIIGMVHALDVFKAGADAFPPVHQVERAPASMPCGEMLLRMLKHQRHLAVVLGDDGLMAGIVTLEDVLDELVDGIRADHDPDATDAAATSFGAPSSAT